MRIVVIVFITLHIFISPAFTINVGEVLDWEIFRSTLKSDRSLIVAYDVTKEIDKKVIRDYITYCDKYRNVSCFLITINGKSDTIPSSSNFQTLSLKREPFGLNLPFIIGLDNSMKVIFIIEQKKYLEEYLKYIFLYYNKEITESTFQKNINELDYKNEISLLTPNINFVVMLSKKGESDKGIKLLNDISKNIKTNEGKILLAKVYLRIEALREVVYILRDVNLEEAYFLRGIAFFLLKEYKNSLDNLLFLYDKEVYKSRVKEYIIKSYEALGEYDKIKSLD